GAWQKTGKHLAVADEDPIAIDALVNEAGTHVMAMPAAQATLPWMGVHLRAMPVTGIDGLAEAVPAPGSDRLKPRWIRAASLENVSSVLSVIDLPVAAGDEATIYVAGDVRPQPAAIHPTDSR